MQCGPRTLPPGAQARPGEDLEASGALKPCMPLRPFVLPPSLRSQVDRLGENLLKAPQSEDTCPSDATKHWSLCKGSHNGKGSRDYVRDSWTQSRQLGTDEGLDSLGLCEGTFHGLQTKSLLTVLPDPDASESLQATPACPVPSPWPEHASLPPRAK